MSKIEPFIPIVYEHNYASPPIGVVEIKDGRILMKLNDNAAVSTEDINTMNRVFAPSYIVTKEKNGQVLEVELLYMSLNANRH